MIWIIGFSSDANLISNNGECRAFVLSFGVVRNMNGSCVFRALCNDIDRFAIHLGLSLIHIENAIGLFISALLRLARLDAGNRYAFSI